MFLRAFWRLSELKAFEASTMIVASTSGVSNTCRMACMAASHPASCPAQSWSGPSAALTSSFKVVRIALLMIRRAVSPIPMGLTPGHLLSVIRQQALRAVSPLGSTCDEQIRLATEAMALLRSAEKEEKEEQRCFQAAASRPEGPAAPSVLRAVLQIVCPSIFSNMMKCGSLRGVSGSIMADALEVVWGGAFLSELPALLSSERGYLHCQLL